jgi:2-amino-4-hydroxy-6-hydroxymethyldihydropteridine diphosphokinase
MTAGSPAHGLDDALPQPVRAVLALGANLGDRAATLRAAVADLAALAGVRVRAASPVVETAPVGGPEQPDYLNAVLLVDTTLSAAALLAGCQQVEAAHGRRREVRWGPRTLDVDIVDYGGVVMSSAALTLPHPRAGERAFVLVPWFAVDPGAQLATGGRPVPVADLLARLGGSNDPDGGLGVRLRPDLTLEVPG